MPSLWYFITVWAGSKKLLGRIKALFCTNLWSGSESTTRARVSWDDCTMPKKVVGIYLILPEDAMKALMSKWVIQTILLGKWNLQIILRYRIKQLQPYPWSMGSVLPMVVLPTILYKGMIQSLAPYYPIMEGDGKNGCILLPDNSKRYFVTQPLVEDGISRLILWHHREQGLHIVHEWIKVV